jgi:hypothetical protein
MISIHSEVSYFVTRGGASVIFQGEVIEIDSDNTYATVRNKTGALDYVRMETLQRKHW